MSVAMTLIKRALESFPPDGHPALVFCGFLRLATLAFDAVALPALALMCLSGTCRSELLLGFCATSRFLQSALQLTVEVYRSHLDVKEKIQ